MADKPKRPWAVIPAPMGGTMHMDLDSLDKIDKWQGSNPPFSTPRKKSDTLHNRDEPEYARGGKVAPNNRFGFATPGRYTKR